MVVLKKKERIFQVEGKAVTREIVIKGGCTFQVKRRSRHGRETNLYVGNRKIYVGFVGQHEAHCKEQGDRKYLGSYDTSIHHFLLSKGSSKKKSWKLAGVLLFAVRKSDVNKKHNYLIQQERTCLFHSRQHVSCARHYLCYYGGQ